MKIVHLVSSLGIGGAEKFAADLCVEQSKAGNKIYLITLDRARDIGKNEAYEQSLKEELVENGVQVLFYESISRKSLFKTLLSLRKMLLEIEPDIVHSHLLIWSVLLSFTKKNYISLFTQHTSFLKFPLIHKIFLHRFIDKYIAISDATLNSLVKVIEKKKIFKIFNGIRSDCFSSLPRKLKSEEYKLITVSRLDDIKNHQLLLKVIATIVSEDNQLSFSLDIVGSGPNELQLKSLAKELNINSYVKFLGTRKDVPELLARSNLFLLPSIREGFSISLIEALCSGINIIASDVGGNREILNDGKFGYLFESNNETDLKEGISYFLRNQVSNRYESSRDEYIKKLSIESSSEEHVKLYNQLTYLKGKK